MWYKRKADWDQIVLSLVECIKGLCCYSENNGKALGVFLRRHVQICVWKKIHCGYSVIMDQRKAESMWVDHIVAYCSEME